MKNIILILALALLSSGCSKTWTGIKQDTHEMITNTKEVVHEVTAPDDVPTTTQAPSAPVQSVAPATTVTPVTDTQTVQTVDPVIPSMTK